MSSKKEKGCESTIGTKCCPIEEGYFKNLHAENLTVSKNLRVPCVDIGKRAPHKGTIVYDHETGKMYYGNGKEWVPIGGGHPIPPDVRLPIEGYWINQSKASPVIFGGPILLQFFRENGHIFVKYYAGTATNVRELTDEDIYAGFLTLVNRDQHQCLMLNDDPNSYSLYLSSYEERYSGEDQNIITFKVQPDLKTAYYILYDYKNAAISQGQSRYVKLNDDQLPPIQKWGATFTGINYNDPRNMFDYSWQALVYLGNPQTPRDFNQYDFPGFQEFLKIKNQIRDVGITYNSTVTEILKTTNIVDTFGPLTTLFTLEHHGANCGSIAKISGAKGVWSILNGSHQVSIVQNNLKHRYLPGYSPAENYRLAFNISLDSSSVSEKYDPSKHGLITITITNGPLNETSEYRELVAAFAELNFQIGGPGTHNRGEVASLPTKRSQILSTWEEVQNALDQNARNTVMSGLTRIRSRLYPRNGTGNFYHNPFVSSQIGNPVFQEILINDPYFFPNTDLYNYNIIRNKYIVPGTFRNLYFRVKFDDADPVWPIQFDLTQYGYWSNGSRFEFMVSETDPGDTWVIAGDNGNAEKNTPGYPSDRLKNQYNCGILQLPSGEKIGYIYVINMQFFDGPYYASSYDAFWDARSQEAGLPNLMNNSALGYATMIQYLNSYGVNKILYNNVNNGGGITSNILASVFGGNRKSDTLYLVKADNGLAPAENQITLVENGATSAAGNWGSFLEALANINVDAVERAVPGGTFRGSSTQRKELIVLTSLNAASDGDNICHRLTGDDPNDPLNIGNNVHVTFIGDLDGRNTGGAETESPFPYTQGSQRLTDNTGLNVTPWLQNPELVAFTFIDQLGVYIGNFNPNLKPSLLLNGTYENTIWLDLGFVRPGNYPDQNEDANVLPKYIFNKPGDNNGNPDPNLPSSWRYRWLEAALRTAERL